MLLISINRRTGLAQLTLLAAALAGARRPADAAEAPVLVFAAASLKGAIDDVVLAWTRARPGSVAKVAYAASSALARQIEQGAPADLFISADLAWMDYLAERGLIRPSSRVDLLGNRLVLIAPAGSAVTVSLGPGLDLLTPLGDGRLAMADAEAVPAGRYGKAALERLGAWRAVEKRVARAENARAALLMVARGEAPLGIVYATDAAAEPRVRVVAAFPEDTHPPIVYPAALVSASNNAAAADLHGFLSSATSRAIFERHGFSVFGLPRSGS